VYVSYLLGNNGKLLHFRQRCRESSQLLTESETEGCEDTSEFERALLQHEDETTLVKSVPLEIVLNSTRVSSAACSLVPG
jgi:hypothetical protein